MRDRVLRGGRVVDAAGRPIAGATVAVVWGTKPMPDIGRRTSGEGAFQVALPSGRFRLQAVAPDGATAELEVEGGTGDEIVIRVESTDLSKPGGRQAP